MISIAAQFYIYELGGHDRYIIHLFNLDEEYNIPTCYQSGALLFSSMLLFLIAINKKNNNDKFKFHWKILAFIFFLLSLDELLSFHEQLSRPIRGALHVSGFLHFAWVIPAIIFLIVLAFFYAKFLFNLSPKFRKSFILSGGIYIVGTIGFEILGGDIQEIYTQKSFLYALLVNIEEILEMVGILLFINALSEYISEFIGQTKIKFL